MVYKSFGKTGIQMSALGFGCMRLPMMNEGSKVDDDLAAPLLLRAFELGVNFFDSHWFYCNYDSQRAVGAALRDIRDEVFISSKIPMWLVEKPEDFTIYLERTLEQMGLEYIDFYHFPYLSYATWTDKILPLKLIDQAEKAKAKGLMRHLSFSFHSDVDKMTELIDTGAFASVMGQYNLLDRENEEFFGYAKSKDVATIVMVPLLGGVLADGGMALLYRMNSEASSAAEMGLRFIWDLPAVDVVLSGMSTIAQLEENAKIADMTRKTVSDGDERKSEREILISRSAELTALNDLRCTNCNYCNECPEKIQIGQIFQLYIQHKVWGLSDTVRARRNADKNKAFGFKEDPVNCTNCGFCNERCPQKIDVAAELKRVWPILMEL